MSIKRFLFIVVLVLFAALSATAQESSIWKRVYTGDDYVIEVNVATLEFGNQILRAQIRTVFEQEVTLKDSGAKSKVQLETIEFRLRKREYRIVQVVLRDAADKPIQSHDFDTAVWKPLITGDMMDRVWLAARPALPFGSWKVSSYRFVEGGTQSQKSSDELDRLVGIPVSFEAEVAKVDEKACRNPAYKSDHYSIAELSRQLGSDIRLPEVPSERVDLIYLKCESDGWEPPQSMLVKLPEGRMLMLWKGVFLTLKRT